MPTWVHYKILVYLLLLTIVDSMIQLCIPTLMFLSQGHLTKGSMLGMKGKINLILKIWQSSRYALTLSRGRSSQISKRSGFMFSETLYQLYRIPIPSWETHKLTIFLNLNIYLISNPLPHYTCSLSHSTCSDLSI